MSTRFDKLAGFINARFEYALQEMRSKPTDATYRTCLALLNDGLAYFDPKLYDLIDEYANILSSMFFNNSSSTLDVQTAQLLFQFHPDILYRHVFTAKNLNLAGRLICSPTPRQGCFIANLTSKLGGYYHGLFTYNLPGDSKELRKMFGLTRKDVDHRPLAYYHALISQGDCNHKKRLGLLKSLDLKSDIYDSYRTLYRMEYDKVSRQNDWVEYRDMWRYASRFVYDLHCEHQSFYRATKSSNLAVIIRDEGSNDKMYCLGVNLECIERIGDHHLSKIGAMPLLWSNSEKLIQDVLEAHIWAFKKKANSDEPFALRRSDTDPAFKDMRDTLEKSGQLDWTGNGTIYEDHSYFDFKDRDDGTQDSRILDYRRHMKDIEFYTKSFSKETALKSFFLNGSISEEAMDDMVESEPTIIRPL